MPRQDLAGMMDKMGDLESMYGGAMGGEEKSKSAVSEDRRLSCALGSRGSERGAPGLTGTASQAA